MSSYYSKDAKCPYYQYDDPGPCNLVCESFAPGSTIKSHFRSKEALRKQAQHYCCDQFEKCTWFQVVSKTYEKE